MSLIDNLILKNMKSILAELEEPIDMKNDNKIVKNTEVFLKLLDKFLAEKKNVLKKEKMKEKNVFSNESKEK